MNFSSLLFWRNLLFLLLVLYGLRVCVIHYAKQRLKLFDSVMLGVISSLLLFSESRITFIVFLYVLLISWGASKIIINLNAKGIHRRWMISGFIILLLIPLIFFKYAGFLASIFGYEYNFFDDYIIPVGISFYTFQLIGYVIDLNKITGTVATFRDEYNFAGFFPQIVAGPIERKEKLLPQIKAFSFGLKREHVQAGLKMIIAGLFYKVVLGDHLAAVSGWCVNPTDNPYEVWIGSFYFGLRIYFDFAGYSMIAVGLGRIFGVHLTQNFKSPYTALNIQQFWARWHYTLSTWFRDYVYIPLGGGRVQWWWVNILVVFVVSGIWHGAGWNFIIWGFIHGCMLIIYKFIEKWLRLHEFVGWLINVIVVTFSWLCFYETNTVQLMHKIAAVFSVNSYSIHNAKVGIAAFGTGLDFLTALLIAGFSVLIIGFEYLGLKKRNDPYWIWSSSIVSCMAVILIYLCALSEEGGFIYFNF